MGDRTGGLTSFGIGLTGLRATAKQVGRDHDLAVKLWNERNHDAKIIGLLIDDPNTLHATKSKSRSTALGQECSATCSARAMRPSPSPPSRSRPRRADGEQDPVRRSCG